MLADRKRVGNLSTVAVLIVAAGCSDSSGPDTRIVLELDQVATPTNQLMPDISGTTDPGAAVRITTPVDTASQSADAEGAFSIRVRLAANAVNDLTVTAVDPAGNQASETLQLLHDDVPPAIVATRPAAGAVTPGPSGFTVSVAYEDDGSGVDLGSLLLVSDRLVGGVFDTTGATSAAYPPGSDLSPLFDVAADSAVFVVVDSAEFAAGPTSLSAAVSDRAGNPATPTVREFTVTADPPELIVVNSNGAPGSSGVPVTVGLASADSVSGVQFDFQFDTLTVAGVDSVSIVGLAADFDSSPFNQISPGVVRVLLFDADGDSMGPGQGAILQLWISIAATAASGAHPLTLGGVVLSEPGGGTQVGLGPFVGTLTVP